MKFSRTNKAGRSIYRVTIYCDDLFLCPECGKFYFPPDEVIPDESWVREDQWIEHRALQEFIQKHKHRPEFQLKACGRKSCAGDRANVLSRMKEAAARAAADAEYRANHERLMKEAEAAAARRSSEVPQLAPIEIIFVKAKRKDHLYLIEALEAGGRFKIGASRNVVARLKTHQTSSPFKLHLLKTWKHRDAEQIETLLKKKYSAFRCSTREWFRLPSDDVQKILKADRIEDVLAKGI